MKYICIMILSALSLLYTGQSTYAQERPKWANGYFEECQNSYIEVVTGIGYDLDDAKNKAKQQIVQRRSLATGTDVVVSSENNNIKITSEKKLVVNARIIDEYYERIAPGEHKVYLLVQTAKNPTYEFEPVVVSEKYPFSGRVFIPGMAQIYKGSVTKGTCFITGEALLIGSIITTEYLRTSYTQQITMTQNLTQKQYYLRSANTCTIIRNISIAGATAIYVWNVIDGIVAKGKKNVFIGQTEVKLIPYSDLQSVGLTLNLNL